MEKIQIGIYDHSTGENVVRDATDEEALAIEAESAEVLAMKAEALAKKEADAIAKKVIFDRLGLTEEEAALVLGLSKEEDPLLK